MEEKGFQALAGLAILTLLIITTINVMYLGIFIMGFFITLILSFYSWNGEFFAGWVILYSIMTTCLAVIIWVIAYAISDSMFFGAGLAGVIGTALPSILASAYLESKGPY